MLCPKCGTSALPIRLACIHCDATLPGVPRAFETPEARSAGVPIIFCANCGAEAFDARMACSTCNGTLPRPFSIVVEDNSATLVRCEDDSDEGYYQVIADKTSCEECRNLEGTKFSKEDLPRIMPPVRTCLNPLCWCQLVYYFPRHESIVQPRKRVCLPNLPKELDGTYNLSGLSKSEIADLIWEEGEESKGD